MSLFWFPINIKCETPTIPTLHTYPQVSPQKRSYTATPQVIHLPTRQPATISAMPRTRCRFCHRKEPPAGYHPRIHFGGAPCWECGLPTPLHLTRRAALFLVKGAGAVLLGLWLADIAISLTG